MAHQQFLITTCLLISVSDSQEESSMLLQISLIQYPSILSILLSCSSALGSYETYDIHARDIQRVNVSSYGFPPAHTGPQTRGRRCPADDSSTARPARPSAPHPPAGSRHTDILNHTTNHDTQECDQEALPRSDVTRPMMQKSPVAGMAGLAFHNRDTKRPSQDTTAARAMHILNQRDPAPISPRADSAASSQGQNWRAPAISNHQSATAKNALRVTAKHYEPYLHKAKEKKDEVLQWQGRVTDRKDVLADTTYARYMANREPLVGQKGLEGEFFKAASEYASERMFLDLAKHRLSAHTRAGAPAKTYAKLRVAGIRPIKKRGSAPSPARSPSAVPHRPTESHASGLLAKSALQVVADHIQGGIPAAQLQSSRAVKAFEDSQRELEGAAKAWRKPFIEAMYHSQQNGMEMNRRYRNNNRDQYRANQHPRILHEAFGKLRDSGIDPRDLKGKHPGRKYPRNLEYTAFSILATQTYSKVPEARQDLFQTARTAIDSRKRWIRNMNDIITMVTSHPVGR